eukprot:6481946-Alexandrium_andersonii.AAC.1
MSASLVGSEMCIRDSRLAVQGPPAEAGLCHLGHGHVGPCCRHALAGSRVLQEVRDGQAHRRRRG